MSILLLQSLVFLWSRTSSPFSQLAYVPARNGNLAFKLPIKITSVLTSIGYFKLLTFQGYTFSKTKLKFPETSKDSSII